MPHIQNNKQFPLKNNIPQKYIMTIYILRYFNFSYKLLLKIFDFVEIMLNKNVADYTNFEGKTNKKIVQAPGGASSFSLAWNDDKVDYPSQRNNRNNRPSQAYDYQNQYQPKNNGGYHQYSEPIKVMESPYQGYNQPKYSQQERIPPMNSYSKQQSQQYQMRGYGEQGYRNVPNQMQQPYGKYSNQVDQIDLAMKQHEMKRPPSVPRQGQMQPPIPPQTQGRSSIKINGPPRQNFVIGNQYNYWKDNEQQSRGSRRQYSGQYPKQENIQTFGQRVPPQEYTTEKTSIKVHNPPGGKQSFTLG